MIAKGHKDQKYTDTRIHTYANRGKVLASQGDLMPLFTVPAFPAVPHSQVLLGFQLPNLYRQTHATHLPVGPTPSVRMELARAFQNTKETRTPGVALSAS